MKKNIVFILLLLISSMCHAYKITNSPDSSDKAFIQVFLKKRARLEDYIHAASDANYRLKPGEHGSWNQKELRKKTKNDSVYIVIEGMEAYSYIANGYIPLGANVEIFIYKTGPQSYVGGAYWTTSTASGYINQIGYDQAREYIKKYGKNPDKPIK